MYFLPTSDQLELQRGVREVLDRAFPLEKLPCGYDPVLWDTLVETGVFALRTAGGRVPQTLGQAGDRRGVPSNGVRDLGEDLRPRRWHREGEARLIGR